MDVTISSKGQITIPKEVRDRLQVVPGDKCVLLMDANGRAVLMPKRSVKRLKGILGKQDTVLTVEDMNRAIRKGQEEAYGNKARER